MVSHTAYDCPSAPENRIPKLVLRTHAAGNALDMLASGLIAVGDSFKELAAIFFIVMIPTVPLTFLAWTMLGRRRSARSGEQEIESGRSPATPFAAISVVGSVIAVAAGLALLLVIAVRAVAA